MTNNSLARRLERLEKVSGTTGPRSFTLEQLVEGSLGHDPGAPRKQLAEGELDLELLVANAAPVREVR